MKKILTVALAAMLTLSLFACGTPDETTLAGDTTPDPTPTEPIVTEPTENPDEPVSTEGNGKHVVTLLMDHERIPTFSGVYGTWGNSGKDIKHQPDKTTEDGLRDIASVYYPSIGLYDVTDPDYQEYMMQLCKMTYIDTLNYYISTLSEVKEGAWWGDNLDNNVVPMLRKYGLYATARLEDPMNSMKTEDDYATIIEGFTTIINKLGDRVLKLDGRPVLAQFSIDGINAQVVEDWKLDYLSKHGAVPFFMVTSYMRHLSDDWNETVDGYFGWVGIEDTNALGLQVNKNVGDYTTYATLEQALNNHPIIMKHINELKAQGKVSFFSESVTPSFDDIAVWGWGTSAHKIEGGENNELYEFKWKSAIANDAQMVTIPTWDDWGEASTIEPTLQYGIDRLEITRKYAAEYKGIEANTASLELPGWIYKIRKTTTDEAVLAKMAEASDLIAEGRFDEAEAIVKPYVDSTGIPASSKDFFNYPTTPTTPLIPVESEESVKPTVDGDTETWTPTADTYVAETNARGIDSGTEKKLRVKNAYKTNLTRNIYIKFDTSATSFEGVSKATLRLYCEWASKHEEEGPARDVKLYATVADWYEEGFSWKTQPLTIEKVADVDTSTNITGKWLEIDVTEYLKYNLGKKISFSLRNEGADTEENHLDFTSREGGENMPQLVIVKGEKTEPKPVVELKELSLTATADSYVASSGGGDKGGEQTVRMKKCDPTGRTRHTYFKFDTTSLKDSQAFKATLRLHCTYASVKENLIKMRYVNLYAVSNDWTEGGFSWEAQPEILEKLTYVDTSDYDPNEWVEIDVTEYVKAHLGEVISFSLRDEGQDHEESHIDFASRESENKPTLVLTVG